MLHFMKPEDITSRLEDIPEELPILPLRNTVAYPFMIIPLVVGIPRSVKLVEEALKTNSPIGLVSVKDPSIEEPQPDQIYQIGTVAKILKPIMDSSEKNIQILVQGLERFRVEKWLDTDSYLRAQISLSPDTVDKDLEFDALNRSLLDLAKEVVALMPNMPDEVSEILEKVDDPRYLIYLVAANSRLEMGQAQRLLEMDRIKDKFRALISHLMREKELLSLGKKIQSEAQQKMGKDQKEYFLRQQLNAIQKELGETEDEKSDIFEFEERIDKAHLPEEAQKEAKRELKRLKGMSPQAAEYSLIKTYLDWLLDIPWNELTEDHLDVGHARVVLDEDHYDLQEVKNRIIEYLAVRKLVNERALEGETEPKRLSGEMRGAILCFVGPPGVGKTSLGESIARALGRKFTRMSLGGIHDEAEIRGHRRTYIGAMPGRIIQAIKRVGTRNPVFMLDEIDKVGSDWRGDPSSALLEVLDPAQNHAFRDHYLDVDFDLSDVMFITTANQLETIPPPLRDRMEVIQLDGYTEYEKVRISWDYLVPRQIKGNGLRKEEIDFSEEALRKIIQGYTREAGVRNLEREIGALCRKVAVKIAGGKLQSLNVTPEIVQEYLKKEKYELDASESFDIPGIATGLAVTAVGGDILFIEATRMSGKGDLTLTGQLGDVMRESAKIALSYIHSKADQFGIDPKLFDRSKVHLHVPAGAIPKDGPSAGIAMVMAMISLFRGDPVKNDLGMTGEVTLRGRVLPVGGIKMKVLAAHRAGLTTVVLPKRNERDLEELPEEVLNEMTFIPIERIDDVVNMALQSTKGKLQLMK